MLIPSRGIFASCYSILYLINIIVSIVLNFAMGVKIFHDTVVLSNSICMCHASANCSILVNIQFHAFDFRTTTRNEPFLQLFHCLYVYPLTVSLGRKRNLFLRAELREDDGDIRRQPLEVVTFIFLFLRKAMALCFHLMCDSICPGNISQRSRSRCIVSEVGSHPSCCWSQGCLLP